MTTIKSSVTIGISDDHPKLRKVMKLCLDLLGYPVILEAENGKVLIEKIDGGLLPDICLLDINMPVMNGYDTTSFLKSNWPSVKVLIYSLNEDLPSRNKAFECGADGYLVKPCTIDEIQIAIEKIINKNDSFKTGDSIFN